MTVTDVLNWTVPFLQEVSPVLILVVAVNLVFRYLDGIQSLFRRM